MSASNGDLIRVVDTQTYLGQTVLNVYYYIVTAALGIVGDALGIMDSSWESTVLTPVVAIQSDHLSHVNREWRNLTNGVDIFNNDTVVDGGNTGGDDLNSFTSVGFLLRRSNLTTRNGYKRFSGLKEGNVSGNTFTISSSFISAIESGLASPLTDGIAELARPVIVKRPIPEPAVSVVHSDVLSASFRGIGTQNSRKPGRGV